MIRNDAVHYSREVGAKIGHYGGTPCTIAVGRDPIWQGGLTGEQLRMLLELIEDRQIADVLERERWIGAASEPPPLPHLDEWARQHREKLAAIRAAAAAEPPPPPPPPPEPPPEPAKKSSPRKPRKRK